jgi:arylsulfatase A-like enzyme
MGSNTRRSDSARRSRPHPGDLSRRQALAAMVGTAALTAGRRLRATADRPNLVFILSDDHRWDAIGFMDKPWLPTPNLDRIAREGAHFANSFATTSLCSPSRASFLTGQYARCHGVTNNLTPWTDRNVSFLELLHGAGYDAAFIGKWHMPGKGLPDLVGQGKLDRMVSFSAAGGQGIYHDCPLIVDGQKTAAPGYITDVLTQYALEFMNQPRTRPFCLYLSHKAVHAFFNPPEKYQGTLAGAPFHELEKNERNFPLGVIQEQQRQNYRRNQQRYYEDLRGVDDSVGAVLSLLDDHALADNTLIVYQGDNGYFWGEHGLIDKRYAYEEGIRVPHLARFPRALGDGGTTVDDMVLNLDLAPTFLEAAGLAIPRSVQGRSYLSRLAPAQPLPGRKSWLYEYFADPGFPVPPIKAVRTREAKLITYPEGRGRFPDELYRLTDDPGERHDLINDPAAATLAAELRAELARLDRELACPPG